jgi:hypothetical protein
MARRQVALGALDPQLDKVEGAKLLMQVAQDLTVGRRSSRTQYQYTLQGSDSDALNAWAPKMLAKLKTLPELRDVATDQQTEANYLDLRSRPGVPIWTDGSDDRRYDHLSAHEAIRRAALLRFRPIMMTTMAAAMLAERRSCSAPARNYGSHSVTLLLAASSLAKPSRYSRRQSFISISISCRTGYQFGERQRRSPSRKSIKRQSRSRKLAAYLCDPVSCGRVG